MSYLIAKITKKKIEAEVRRFKDSGELLNSWRVRRGSTTSKIWSDAPHAEIEDGGGFLRARNAKKMMLPKNNSHAIRALIMSRPKNLVFKAKAIFLRKKFGLEFLAARRDTVYKPGHHYIVPAMEKAEREVLREILREIDQIDKRTGG